jgi:cytochrome d ubiquinol oxidase subunit II
MIYTESYKYLHNLQEMPVVAALLLIGVLMVLGGIAGGLRGLLRAFRLAGPGSVLVVLALLLCAGWNNTVYYPSLSDAPESSLTIANSSSSLFTLKTMTYVSFIIPLVIAYITWAWRALSREPISADETHD